MQWKRPIVSSRINALWESLQAELQHVTHFEGQDEVCWGIGHDGTFTVAATRHQIDDAILPTLDVSTMWCKILPKKVNIFLWRLNLDRIPHRFNLSRRGLKIQSISCPLCSNGMESNNHIFYTCDVALHIWRLVRIWCDMPIPVMYSHSS